KRIALYMGQKLRGIAVAGSKMILPVVAQPEHDGKVSVTQPARGLDDGAEHRLEVEARAADDIEHIAGRGLVFERLLKVTFARLLGLQQSRVLDGDDGLVGEGLQKFDVAIRKRTSSPAHRL